jgi:hypothetical protein
MQHTSRLIGVATIIGILSVPSAFGGQKGKARSDAKERDREEVTRSQDGAQMQMQTRFRGMDKDGDGVITRAEWRGNDQSFRQQDTNGDGVLSGDEVRSSARAVTPPANDTNRAVAQTVPLDRLNERFSRLDRDSDGRLGRNEWTVAHAVFDRADLNHDGTVSRTEFIEAMRVQPARAHATGTSPDPARGTRAYQAGHDRGLTEGRQAGKEDRNVNGGKWDLEGQRELEQADSGFDARLGTRGDYQAGYRAGFRLGYGQGFGPR